jgi:hypothetical protein
LFIKDKWYRILDTYSSSTRKQMSQVNPVRYDSNLHSNVMGVTKGEMERLIDGRYDVERVNTERVSNFVRDKDSVINKSKLVSGGYGDDAHRVSFIISDVDEIDGKIKIFVKVLKAGKMVDRKMVVDSDYQNNPQLVNNIENTIKQTIMRDNPKYLTDSNTEIEVIH